MCTGLEPALIAGLVTSAAGAGVSAYSNNQAMRKQDSEAAAGIIRQSALQKQAQAGVTQTIQKVAQSTPQQSQVAQNNQYLDALRQVQPVQKNAIAGVPGSSTRYAEDVGSAQKSDQQFGVDQANIMSRTDAPLLQRMKEGQILGNEATNLGLLNDTSNAQDYLTKLRTAAIQPNPWLSATGQILSGVGAGLSKRKPGAATPNSFDNGSDAFASDLTKTNNAYGMGP